MVSAFCPRVFSTSCYMNLIILFTVFGNSTCSSRGNETDRLSLLVFKSLIKDDQTGALDSWNDTFHLCGWQGITCSKRHQRVIVLNLQSLKLAGSIAPHIGNLSFLRELNLGGNKFTGEIPPEMGYLKRLKKLELFNNSLNGEISPNLFNCSELTVLNLGGNQLVGEIPMELGTLANLQSLIIPVNHLSGKIPASIGNLSSLNDLYAADNGLHGSIPYSFNGLKNIQTLAVAENNLSGTIPLSIFNLSTLIAIDFTANYKLQGSLPPTLFTTLPNLQFLGLTYNHFSGSIPVSISNATNLMDIELGENQFSGSVPSMAKLDKLDTLLIWGNQLGTGGANDLNFLSSLNNSTRLQWVGIGDNCFGGRLPESISNFSLNLIHFYIYRNQISGEIPSGIGNLVNLESLSMRENRISGIIPGSIGKLRKLVKLYLDRNRLTGEIPSSIGNLTQLATLGLGSNFLQGKIPPTLGMLQGLGILDLSKNNLTGLVPIEIFGIPSQLIALDLSQNNLVGILPTEVGNLSNLGWLYVSENQFSGVIPVALGRCISLEHLNMSGNKLQGTIPQSLSSLRGLEDLDLSRNNLSGQIPRFLENLNLLKLLNLSYNHFEGMVPVGGVFKNISAIFITGNFKLCGGSVELHLPNCSSNKSKRQNPNLNIKLISCIVSILLGALLLALFVFLRWSKKRKGDPPPSNTIDKFLRSVSYHTLLKATNGFSDARLIGVGAFGSVYKGIIGEGQGEKIIAVKVLNMLKRGAIKSFLAECEALKNIRHRNLVKVLTACSGFDSSGNDFKALVYEFMVNGSLENWLHPTYLEENGVNETPRRLSLLQRLNIAIDTAWSLDYLHHQCENPVVHCDLKPSNILLDGDMVAHVGDFGLAKFISRSISEASTNQSSSLGVRGSTGYVPPEYGLGNEVSTQGDVYSYGISLLEMFTGKRPTDEMFGENMNLHGYVKKALPDEVEEIADPVLLEELQLHNPRASTGSRKGRVMECLVSVFQVGVYCSNEVPGQRMDMAEVAAELNSIRKILGEG